MPKKRPDRYYCWLIAYIDSTTVNLVQKEIQRNPEYKEVEVFIPMVKVLKKTHKGEHQFEDVPLLFNYGFFKVPRKYAVSAAYLDNMQNNITCLYGWLKDPHKNIMRDATRKWKKIKDQDIPFATATSEEVTELVKKSFDYSIHSAEDMGTIKAGDFITLRGYPFDGLQAEVSEIDYKKKQARVMIHIFEGKREVDVSFDNIFFTVYQSHNYDDSLSNYESLDEMAETKKLDKKLFKSRSHESE